jgi:pimeloyl-ACP methyl ester carboxylesterase
VLGIVEVLDVDRFHLVGHDWGGVLAWKIAGDHPDRLRSLSVLSTPHTSALRDAENDDTSDQATRSAFLDSFTGPNGAGMLLALNSAGLRTLFGGLEPEDIDYYVGEVGNEEVLNNALNYRRANGISPIQIGTITVDTLYIHGADDPAFGRDAAERTAQHVSAEYRFESLEGVNHWVPDIAPDIVTPWLLEHIEAH